MLQKLLILNYSADSLRELPSSAESLRGLFEDELSSSAQVSKELVAEESGAGRRRQHGEGGSGRRGPRGRCELAVPVGEGREPLRARAVPA